MSSAWKNSAISVRERRAARDPEPQAAAEALLHLRVDEPVGDPVLERERRGSGSPRAAQALTAAPDARAPSRPASAWRRSPRRTSRVTPRGPSRTRAARSGSSVGRTARQRVARRAYGSGQNAIVKPDVGAGQVHAAARSCARAAGRAASVVLGARGPRARRRRRHGVVVAVADHAALRRAGRPGGVDVREEVVLARPRPPPRRARPGARARERAACRSSSSRSAKRRRCSQSRERSQPSILAALRRRPRRGRRPPPSGRARRRRRRRELVG